MERSVGVAARLPESDRRDLAIQALAGSATVSDLAARHGVSRKFIYQQTDKARTALDDVFLAAPEHEALPQSLDRPKSPNDVEWIRQHRVKPAVEIDSGVLLRQMRDEYRY